MPDFAFDPLFLAVALPVVLLSGIAKGGFGGSFDVAAAPILALVIDPAAALALMLPLLLAMDVAAVRAYWRQWDARETRTLVLWGLPGVVAGMILLGISDANLVRALIGLMALAFVAFRLAQMAGRVTEGRQDWPRSVGRVLGVLGGFGSFVAHAGGPAIIVWMLSRGLSKTAYQGTIIVVFLAINLAKVPAYTALGFFDAGILLLALALVPLAILGVWLGIVAHRRISERAFFAFAYVVLALVGVRLLWLAVGG